MGLTRFAISRPLATLMLIIGLVILGIQSYRLLRVDRLPNISTNVISVRVGWSGASPEDVEEYILKRLEGAVSGLPGVASIQSQAGAGNGFVIVTLSDGVDVNAAAVDLDRRVSQIRGQLPADATAPTVFKADPNAIPIMNIALTSNRPIDELLDMANNTVVPRLQSISGIGDVTIIGGLQREVQVLVNLSTLASYGVTLQQISAAITRENLNQPVGSITENNQTITLRSIGQYQSADQLRDVVVLTAGTTTNGQVQPGGNIRLGQLATITDGFKEQTRIQRLNGSEAIGISITKQSDANALTVADRIKDQIANLKTLNLLPSDVSLVITNDTSRFTRNSLHAVEYDLGLAVVLTALVLLVFLHSWRNVVIVLLAIPTSLISTLIFMYAFGLSINTITLMALALAIGILVDDSIVVIENIHRHLKMGEGPLIAALNGRSEIGLAALSITAVDIIVYLPIAFMQGNLGKLFREYGLTIAIATFFSLFISFTLTPMLASRFLSHHEGGKVGFFERFGLAFDWAWDKFATFYGHLLRLSLRARPLVILIAAASLVAALSLLQTGKIGQEYSPTDDDSQFRVNVNMPQGTSLANADAMMQRVEAFVRSIPEVDQVFTSIGQGNNITVQLVDKSDRSRTVFEIAQFIRSNASQFQGANLSVSIENPLQAGAGFGGGGGGANSVNVQIRGEDIDKLNELVPVVDSTIRAVRGVVDVRLPTGSQQEIRMMANRQRMADLGVTQQTIASTVRAAISGSTVGALRPEGQLQRDITLITRKEDRANLAQLSTIPIPASGGQTRLGNVADLVRGNAPSSVTRIDRQRTISLNANIAGRALGETRDDLRAAVQQLELPAGYQVVVSGSVAALDAAFASLFGALGLSVILIYMLMVALYESWLHPLAIMFSLPVAITGALVGLWVTGNTLNVFSMIGMVMLMGLVAKNGILLVDYTNTLRSRGKGMLEAVIEAGPTRLKPIVMTSATIIMAMTPLALKLEAGAESRAPLAVVVIGGVISSTVLTLFLVPAMYTYLDAFGNFVAWVFRGFKTAPIPALVHPPLMVPLVTTDVTTTIHETDGIANGASTNGASTNNTEATKDPGSGARPRRWFGRR